MSRLIMVSNRVADLRQSGHWGGLSVALVDALRPSGGIWFGWNGNIDLTGLAAPAEVHTVGTMTTIRLPLTQQDYDEYYLGFCNSVLWPIFHYRLDLADFQTAYMDGYNRFNSQLADTLIPLIEPDDVIWIHDFHLIPLASELRKRGCDQKIGFFLHIPFPSPEIFSAAPAFKNLREAFRSYDLVGVQTSQDLQNFRKIMADQDPTGVPAGASNPTSRATRSGSFPIGIDVETFRQAAIENTTNERIRNLQQQTLDQSLIIGVDRLDYSKGLPDRFSAFRRLLRRHADLQRQVTLMQIAPPTREDVGAYAQIRDELQLLSGAINGEFADIDWTPIRYIHQTIPRSVLAPLYRTSRVGLVTPLRDGMNLVAKEYIAAQDERDPGVLVLSKYAGAAEQLKEALIVNPYDADEMADALYTALHMPKSERIERQNALLHRIRQNDANNWQKSFLSSLLQ